jgi:hypothetical protein
MFYNHNLYTLQFQILEGQEEGKLNVITITVIRNVRSIDGRKEGLTVYFPTSAKHIEHAKKRFAITCGGGTRILIIVSQMV